MVRVVVHAGFHKTGTTTVQRGLRENRALLRRHAKLVFRPAMVAVCEAARGYSATRSVLDLGLFKYELALLAEQLRAAQQPAIVISAEDLSGHMPGRRGVRDYSAAPVLLAALAEVLTEFMAPAAPEFTFYLSTRESDAWLHSVWAQTLQSTRLTMDRAQFSKAHAGAADLDGAAAAITAALAPHPVHHARLETNSDRPDRPLLGLVDLPRRVLDGYVPAERSNAAPSDHVLDRLLDLNRSDLDDAALREAKRALVA